MRVKVMKSSPWMFGIGLELWHFFGILCLEVSFWRWHIRIYLWGWPGKLISFEGSTREEDDYDKP